MENLIKYISYLVARHNCVIIPGMGAFLADEVPAHYNVEERVFVPPYRTMRFNPQVKADDALLISEYIDREQLTYEEAGRKMNNEIDALREALTRNSVVRFGELGTFHMNIKGELSFDVDSNGIDDPANFGFEPFAFPLLRDCEDRKIVIKHRDLGKYIAAAVAIILTFIFVTPMSDSAYKKSMQASFSGFASNEQISLMQQVGAPAPKQVTDEVAGCEIMPIDANGNMEMPKVQPQEEAPKAVATTEAAPAIAGGEVAAVNTENKKVYHIIVASSPNESNAQLAIEELSAKMTANYTVVKGGGRHRISIGEYASNKEAMEAAKELKSTFPDAWVLQTNAQ